MKPIDFPESSKTLMPSGQQYSSDVGTVKALPTWSDGEQCVSCWKLSLRERIAALIFGKVWVAVLSGYTQPPVYAEASRSYFKPAA